MTKIENFWIGNRKQLDASQSLATSFNYSMFYSSQTLAKAMLVRVI